MDIQYELFMQGLQAVMEIPLWLSYVWTKSKLCCECQNESITDMMQMHKNLLALQNMPLLNKYNNVWKSDWMK